MSEYQIMIFENECFKSQIKELVTIIDEQANTIDVLNTRLKELTELEGR